MKIVETNANFVGRQFAFVREERIYEIKDGKREVIRQGGDFILKLAGHDPELKNSMK